MSKWIPIGSWILDCPAVGALSWAHRGIFLALILHIGKNPYLLDDTLENTAWRIRCDIDEFREAISAFVMQGLVTEKDERIALIGRYHYGGIKESSPSTWLKIRAKVLHRDGHLCQYCGAPAEHVDHVVPRCQNGTDDLDNLVAACAHCNLTKSGRTPEQAGMEFQNA